MGLMWAFLRRCCVALCVGAIAIVFAAPAGAKPAGASFKATNWIVYTGGELALPPTAAAVKHVVAPNGALTLCNMGQFATLTLNFTYKNTPGRVFDKRGKLITPYRSTFTGPEGSQTASYVTERKTGKGAYVWAFVGDFPGHKSASQPIPAGKYTFVFKQGSKTVMRSSITFASSNTC